MTDDIPQHDWGPSSAGWSEDSTRVDLFVLGALTIDSFGRRRAPGGSVLHAARGASLAGFTVAVATIAGDEPEATAGIEELARLAVLHVQRARATVRFRHTTTRSRRLLHLDSRAAPLKVTQSMLDLAHPRAVLFAPVAGEIGPGALRLFADAPWRPVRAANLQGWLRRVRVGRRVIAVPIKSIGKALVRALSAMDLLVLSREDLADDANPWHQLDELRHQFGDRPVLVLTDSANGAWVDDSRMRYLRAGGWSKRWRQPVPRWVEGVPTVGAGDVLAGLMAVQIWLSPYLSNLKPVMVSAMEGVADLLETRRQDPMG